MAMLLDITKSNYLRLEEGSKSFHIQHKNSKGFEEGIAKINGFKKWHKE